VQIHGNRERARVKIALARFPPWLRMMFLSGSGRRTSSFVWIVVHIQQNIQRGCAVRIVGQVLAGGGKVGCTTICRLSSCATPWLNDGFNDRTRGGTFSGSHGLADLNDDAGRCSLGKGESANRCILPVVDFAPQIVFPSGTKAL